MYVDDEGNAASKKTVKKLSYKDLMNHSNRYLSDKKREKQIVIDGIKKKKVIYVDSKETATLAQDISSKNLKSILEFYPSNVKNDIFDVLNTELIRRRFKVIKKKGVSYFDSEGDSTYAKKTLKTPFISKKC